MFFFNHRTIQIQHPETLHFLHIGKTGGTALKHLFKEYNKGNNKYQIKLYGHKTKLNDIPVGEPIIFFLRDPISRFVSGFYSRQRQGAPRYSCQWNELEKEAFTLFNTPNELAEALSDRDSELNFKAEAAMKNIRHVNSHYYDTFINKDYFQSRKKDILFIGFQELLGKDYQKLKKILKIPKGLTLPDDEFLAHRSPEHLDKKLSDKAIIFLREWYKEDILFLESCRGLRRNNFIHYIKSNFGLD